MAKVTIIIPTKTEKFLRQTTEDVLKKATGDIEVLVGSDGEAMLGDESCDIYEVEDPRVKYFCVANSTANQKRHIINKGVSMSTGDYIMTLDAHCKIGPGFDEILVRDHQPDWVQIPRRLRLDAENWEVQFDSRPPIDYEYWKWQDFKKGGLHGYKWDARTIERMNTPIDETLHFQGSCYFMTKEFFHKRGLMQIDGFGGFTQEAEEITLKTWLSGGKVMVNKNTWYAHLHKGKKYGRMYNLNWEEKKAGDAYSYDLFVNQNREAFVALVEKFMPLPNWPEDWEKRIYG